MDLSFRAAISSLGGSHMTAYRVSILAAGGGQRFGDKSRFGHKALFRVGNKAVISHIIELFPGDAEFVIALGHNGHLIRQYIEMFYPDGNFIYVASDGYGSGYGPGYSLNLCREHLQLPFYSFACDTIVRGFVRDESSDWVGYSHVAQEATEKYCTLRVNQKSSLVEAYFDKTITGTTEAWIGLAFVQNFQAFWNAMNANHQRINGEIQLAPALFSLPVMKAKLVSGWYDTGHPEGLAVARQSFGGLSNLDKPDEEIYFDGDSVVKYFYNRDMVAKRLERAAPLGHLVPRIEAASANFYRYEYIHGTDLSRVADPDSHLLSLLEFSQEHLWKRVQLECKGRADFRAVCRKFYHDKTILRISSAGPTDREYVINGIRVPALEKVLGEIDWEWLCDGIPSMFHGDFNLSNIILASDGTFRFIDWRQDFGGNTHCGDIYYDLAKLYHSFIWPHSSVRQGDFVLKKTGRDTVVVDIAVPGAFEACSGILKEWSAREGYDHKKIEVLGALVLLNIAPLHESPLCEHLHFWGRYKLCRFQAARPLS
jgi:choline kinase